MLLVHGGFADGSIWADVITELQAAGLDGVALANPLRSLASNTAYLASATAEIDGPVILGGHPHRQAVAAAAAQRPMSVAAFEEKAPAPAWKTVPSWYVIATQDQVIPAGAPRFVALRARSHAAEVHASHAVALTHPAAVAELIAAAASALRPTGPARRREPRQPQS